ncbi:hypothetical protein CBS101457_006193 [Exobasidium rhododendri]|nr:hypothetical protein CBS101457_006193 [Exobasidium rhododendri]
MAAPAITTCQHALNGVLHDLARRSECHPVRPDKKSKKRSVIIDWRGVLSVLASRPSVPSPIYQATQERLHKIYGDSTYVPPPSWKANMGMGGKDHIYETLKSKDPMPSKWKTANNDAPAKEQHKVLRELDKTLLYPRSKKRARYLQSAPIVAARKTKKKKKQTRIDPPFVT